MEKRAANLLLSGKRCFLPIINRKFKSSVSVSVRNQSISRSSLKLCDDLSCKNQFPRLPRSQTFLLQCKFSREGRWKRKRARSTLQLGSDRQTRDPLGETQGIEILWTLQASAFSSRYLSPKYPRIQTAPFRKGQVKKPRYQVSITITVFFFIHFYVEIGGMVNVPLSSPPPPLRDGPHITIEPPLTVTYPQLDCDQSLYFFRFSEGKTRARVENALSHRRDHFPVSRVSLDRLRKKKRDCPKPTPQRPPLCNGHFFCPCGQKIHTMTLV